MRTCTVYYTSDIHGYLFPTTYADDTVRPLGLLSAASLFQKDSNTLILDGGDTIQGSQFLELLKHKEGERYPIVDVMNEIGYDYVALGNHDFNYGYSGLQEFLNGLDAQALCANLTDELGLLPIVPAAVTTLENGLIVGIVGSVTEYVNHWESEETLEGLTIHPPYEVLENVARTLRDQVDILIGIYHGGYECNVRTGEIYSDTGEDIGCRLARELPFDLLLTGHQHAHTEAVEIHGTYTLQPAPYASEVAKITMSVDSNRTITFETQWLHPTGAINQDLISLPKLLTIEDSIQRLLDEPLGTLDTSIAFDGRLNVALHGSPLASLINLVQTEAAGSDLSATCLYNIAHTLGPDLTIRAILNAYEFPNTVKALRISGAELKRSLERSAEYFMLDKTGSPALNIEQIRHERDHFNYDFFSGIEYSFDLSKPIGFRVTRIIHEGNVVRDDDVFTIALNSYRASGGGGYPWYRQCPVVLDAQEEIPSLIIDFVRKNGHVAVPSISSFDISP
jgi:2',3'-cyclic-nucleotide 2'-phosphodiesterase/3'-nucleotidase